MVNLKEQVGIKAAEFVKDGMIVGLGTGSTAYYFVAELGRRIKEEGLQITAVTTSSVTYDQAESLGIPLKAIDDVEVVDVTVDGADEVDPQLLSLIHISETVTLPDGDPDMIRQILAVLK